MTSKRHRDTKRAGQEPAHSPTEPETVQPPTEDVSSTLPAVGDGTAPAGEPTVALTDEAAGHRPRLVPTGRRARGQELVLEDDCEVVGRGPRASLRITWDAHVSSMHAQIERCGEDWVLTDLGAKNRTEVNGERIEARTALREGDVVKIGHGRYVFTTRPRARSRWRRLLLPLAVLLLVAVGVALIPSRKTPDATPPPDDQRHLVQEVTDALADLTVTDDGTPDAAVLSRVDAWIARVRNPETAGGLRGLREHVCGMLKTGPEVVHAARKFLADARRESLARFRQLVEDLRAHWEHVSVEKRFPEGCSARLFGHRYVRTAEECEKAASLVLRLAQARDSAARRQALQAIHQWRQKPCDAALARLLGQKADVVQAQEFEAALRSFDFDSAAALLESAADSYRRKDQEQRLAHELGLLRTLQSHTKDWYRTAEIPPPRHATVLGDLLDHIAAAQQHHQKLLQLIQRAEQELQKDEPDTAKLLTELDANLEALAQLTQAVRRFPGREPQPASLRFLADCQPPAEEWEVPAAQLRALLRRWQPFRQAAAQLAAAEDAPADQLERVAEEGRQVHLTVAGMTHPRLQTLVARLGDEIARSVRPGALRARDRARAAAAPAAQAALLRALLDLAWCRDAQVATAIHWARGRIREIEREGETEAILAYLLYRLGDAEEAARHGAQARTILGEEHPWMAKLKP